jgi:dihydropteroate synthase
MLAEVANSDAAVCVMHMRGEPRSMQDRPEYADVVAEVGKFLAERVQACRLAGIAGERIAIDPGFGFGKLLEHNLALMNGLEQLAAMGSPLLVGLSRKSLLGALTGRAVDERLAGSLALATLAASRGANIIRAHDVAPTVDAVRIAAAVRAAAIGATE